MPAPRFPFVPPLTRAKPWYPGVLGVPGTDTERGLRQSATGCVFYVDPNYPGVSDARDGTDPEAPFQTVQAAVNACEDYRGDVIYVMFNGDWQYANAANDYPLPIAEQVILNKAGVRLIGVSPSPVGVPWVVPAAGGIAIHVTAIDCLIEGFAFGGFVGGAGGIGILGTWDGTTTWADNLTVRDCFFDNEIDIGIQLDYVWYYDIENCRFEECDNYGIYCDPADSAADFGLIRNCWFVNCGTGAISLDEVDHCLIDHNYIWNAHAQAGAAATNEGIDTSAGAENLVTDNFFSCLLPVPAAGDWDDLNSASATDAWVGNHCMNGLAVSNPT